MNLNSTDAIRRDLKWLHVSCLASQGQDDDVSCIICNTIRSFLAHSCFWTFHLGQWSLPMSRPVLKDLYQLPRNFYCSNWNAFRSEKRWAVFKVRNKNRKFVLWGFFMLFYFTRINVCMGETWRKFGGEFSNYEFGKSLDCEYAFSAPAWCSAAEICNQLFHGFLEENDPSLCCNLNIFILTCSYLLSLSFFFRLNISFAMGLTKNVCLLQPNSQRRKHWRYVQSSKVNISWLSVTKQVVPFEQTVGNSSESFPKTRRSLWFF